MVIGSGQLEQHIKVADGHQAADAQATERSCVYQRVIGIAHVNGGVQGCGVVPIHVDMAAQTVSAFSTQLDEGLQIRPDGNAEFKRDAEIDKGNRHGIMHLHARDMLIGDVGASLHIVELGRDDKHVANRDVDKDTAHRRNLPCLRQTAQIFVVDIMHPRHVDAALDANGYRVVLLRHGTKAEQGQEGYYQYVFLHDSNFFFAKH